MKVPALLYSSAAISKSGLHFSKEVFRLKYTNINQSPVTSVKVR